MPRVSSDWRLGRGPAWGAEHCEVVSGLRCKACALSRPQVSGWSRALKRGEFAGVWRGDK